MFSYKNFIKSYLTGTKSKKKNPTQERFIKLSYLNLLSAKKIRHNSISFSESIKTDESFIHLPKVPQLPSLSTPRKKKLSKRSHSINNSYEDEKLTVFRISIPARSNEINNASFTTQTEPIFNSINNTSLKISTLNTKYQSNQRYIMKNLEKAKKYFPIPLGRKQLRTSSMSISHTPMSRLYSPQNFALRKQEFRQSPKIQEIEEMPIKTIGIVGRCAIKKKSFKLNNNNHYQDLYDHMIRFFAQVDIYKKKFEEIDRAKKGYILIEDLKYITENSEVPAERLFKLLSNVSNRNKITKKDFLGICSIYEHNCSKDCKFKLNDFKLIALLEHQLIELHEIFDLHAKNNIIHKQYLQEITEFLQPTEDVYKAESLILTEIVDFSWFLRCIPYFLYLHIKLLDKAIKQLF